MPEGRESVPQDEPNSAHPESEEATEEELSAILNGKPFYDAFLPFLILSSSAGTIQPSHIPVNVFIPTLPLNPPSSLESMSSRQPTPSASSRIVMTLQVRDSGGGAGLSSLTVTVAHDRDNHGRGKSMGGVRVEVAGTLPYTTQQSGELEELVRRGAVFGVAGRVWKWTT